MNAFRVWLTRAKQPQLKLAGACGLTWACRTLVEDHGWSVEALREPTVEQLATMLRALDVPLARCALYGLLSPDMLESPLAAMVEEHTERLFKAADQHPPPHPADISGRVVSAEQQPEPDSSAPGASTTPGEQSAPGAGRDAEIDGLLAELGDAGQKLTDSLRSAADAVESGRRPSAERGLVDAVTMWVGLRDRAADLCADTGVDWSHESGYSWLAAERARLKRSHAELAALRERSASYATMIDAAMDPEEAATLTMLRNRVQAQIAELDSALRDGGTSATLAVRPARETDAPGADADSGDDSGAGRAETVPEALKEASETSEEMEPLASAVPLPSGESAAGSGVEPGEPGPRASGPYVSVTADGAETPAVSAATQRAAAQEEDGVSAVEPAVTATAAWERVPVDTSVTHTSVTDASGMDDTGSRNTVSKTHAETIAGGISSVDTITEQEPWPASVADADWDVRAPWETGKEPPVAVLVRSGRLAEAYWLTEASAEPDIRARALSFAAAAFDCASESEATAVQITHDLDAALLVRDRDAYLVAFTAALRAGLTACWPHALVSDFSPPAGLAEPWQDLLTVLVAGVRNGRSFDPGTQQADDAPQDLDLREQLGIEGRQLRESLSWRKTKYQRATRVLQDLVGSGGQLGQALNDIIQWAEGGPLPATSFAARVEQLRSADDIDRLIEQSDSRFRTPKQAKEPITAGALRQLHTACRSVADVLTKADAVAASFLRQSGPSPSGMPELAPVRRGLRDVAPPAGVGGAALELLHRWLDGKVDQPGAENRPAKEDGSPRPTTDSLLTLFDLPRDSVGMPDLQDPRTARRMAALMAPPDVEQALRRYLTHGDLHLARALVDAVRQHPVGYGAPEPEWAEGAERRVQQAQESWRESVLRHHTEAAVLLAQMRTLNLLAPDQEREFTGRLQEFADGELSGRYRYAVDRLEALRQELSQLVERSARRQRQELEQLRLAPGALLTPSEYDRIANLITEGDTVTAEEFLALARGGRQLPERPEDDGEELGVFLAGLTGPGVPQPGGDGVDATWWTARYGAGAQLTEAADLGLRSWKALCTRHGRNSEWQQHLPRVLRLLGLEPSGQPVLETRTQGVRRFEVRARVVERPGYVAALGSQATSYTVQLIWEEQLANGPLAHLEDADVDANIVLYLHPLGVEGRRRLADAARGRAQQALVVDPAVVGWMAAAAPGSFRALQRVTLPWAAYNPYTPFVAGLVPPEVFYGRDEEMREVMDPRGGLFLYGGRQLGKSALLRRVARIFPRRSDNYVAVYLDLLKAEIGQAEAPDKIWSLLADELKRRGVFGSKMSEQAGPETVARRLSDWLDTDESRRLLVLADEADAFLTADSRRTFRTGGESTFPHVKRFQQLMEHSERRFKIVFAGLHQVQRFGALSNVSTAHGGPDVLVGPLKPQAALRLVTEPMAALGFVFERPELVWRILAITNYQANLVQIFCSELVRTLHARPYAAEGRATAVSESDVQEVAASETLRRRIAERLRFTINLEDRYRVLALLVALESLKDGYRGDYSAKELLDLARDAWPTGFEECGVQQAEIYLNEMVGLGLLIRLGNQARFAVRSPNVVNMLGTQEELETELHETEFGLPYDYNPRAARRILGRDRASGVQRYSPLTEGQLHETAQPGVSVVSITDLHRPDLVLQAVSAFAEGRGVKVVRSQRGEDLAGVLSAARPRTAQVVLADLRGTSADALGEELRLCVEHAGPAADKHVPQNEGRKNKQSRSVLVLADAEVVGTLRGTDMGRRLRVRILQPRRWTADSLRAWPECPFDSREERRRLTDATSGWSHLTEVAVADVSLRGATLEDALDHIRTVTVKPVNVDAHLRRSGLDDRDLPLLALWTEYVEEGQGVPIDDVEAATGLTLEETRDWLVHLNDLNVIDETDGGVALDPVTFRAVRARAAESV